MIGHKAQTPLLLGQYDCSESIYEKSWVQLQYELEWAATKQALKSM